MMNLIAALLQRVQARIVWLVLAVLILGSLGFTLRPRGRVDEHEDAEERLFVEVKRVLSAQKVKLDSDRPEDEYLIYAGIRAPSDGEPMADVATRRNSELVEGREVRIRFDEQKRDKDGRLVAYLFSGETFVNEVLVREGLAYARLTPTTSRFSKRLLDAQAEARKAKRGLWNKRVPAKESSFAADPKYGNFHRLSCEEVSKTPHDRVAKVNTEKEAFDRGFAPCIKCKP